VRLRRVAALFAAVAAVAACGGTSSADPGPFASAYSAHQPAEVTVQGTVTRILPDSPDRGSGVHERFDLDVAGIVVEIDHNVSIADRVPVKVGSVIIVHGQFEPDSGHPVIHFTHRATGRHEAGWIELDGKRYD
jgi:hypothetical protein